MSCSIIHDSIRNELEETSAVYTMVVDTSGALNMDYAGYACHVALNRFQQLLENSDISADQLESMMRKVVRKYAIEDTERKWAHVMARYMARYANINQLNS